MQNGGQLLIHSWSSKSFLESVRDEIAGETARDNRGVDSRCEGGQTLVDFVKNHSLQIMSLFFDKKVRQKLTQKSPSSVANCIHLILTHRRDMVKNVTVPNRLNVGATIRW